MGLLLISLAGIIILPMNRFRRANFPFYYFTGADSGRGSFFVR